MKPVSTLVALLLVGLLSLPLHADTLRVMTHNTLNFGDNEETDPNRLDDFRIIINWARPDVVAAQEIHNEDAVDQLLSFVYLQNADDWAAAQFDNGPDTDNMLFYRTSKVELVSQRSIPTQLRDFNEYVLRPVSPDTSQRIYIYSAHLKASSGQQNEDRRAAECQILRNDLNQRDPGALFLMVGDFNLYTSEEEAYQILLSESSDPHGQLFDPIDSPGDPWNSPVFAPVHTQSSRLNSIGDGGASGGMDDRFDFILCSAGLMDTAGTYVIPEAYHTVGNDGQHYNQSVNNGTNNVVPDSVADALFYASDHLPVVVDLMLRMQPTQVADAPVPHNNEILSCYPNPFN